MKVVLCTGFSIKRPKMQRYEIVDSLHKLKRLAKKLMKVSEFAFDTETGSNRCVYGDGLRAYGPSEDFLCACITISWGSTNNYFIPLNMRREEDVDRNLCEEDVVKYLQPIFERKDVRVIGANIKFDFHVLTRIGFKFKRNLKIFDVILAAWIVDENYDKGLKPNSARYLGFAQEHFQDVVKKVPKEIKKEFGLKANQKATFDLVSIDEGAPYALDDSFCTWYLYLVLVDKVEEEGMDKILYKHMNPFMWCLYRMEEKGVVIDKEKLEEMSHDIQKDLDDLNYEMTEILGVEFNAGSSQQLASILYGEKKVSVGDKQYEWYPLEEGDSFYEESFFFRVNSRTNKGAPSTDADALWNLSQREYKTKRKREGVAFCKVLMQYKELEKLRSAFIDGMYKAIYDDGKVHCSFNQVGADSGRLSCSNPNLQQLPRPSEDNKYQIRGLFIGDEDSEGNRKKIIACDFSNLEIRVNAHFSKDERLLEMFANGEDVHGSTAVNMFELDCEPNEAKKKYKPLRQAAKVLNFLLIYGGSAPTLYNNLKNDRFDPIDLGDKEHLKQYAKYGVKDGVDVAQIYIDKYFSTYKGVANFIKSQHRFAHRNGYVNTILKRKRRLPDINSHNRKMVSYCERLSVNAPIQGSAADITSATQIRIDRDPWFYEHECYMLIQVHDELVFECPVEYVDEAIERIKHYFKYPFGDDYDFVPTLESEADSGWSYAEAK